MTPFFKDNSILVHQLSVIQQGVCTICGKHIASGTKVFSGLMHDGTCAVACTDCKDKVETILKERVYYPQETKVPDMTTKLWRYQDFAKFVSLIDTRCLFFTRADTFEDPFEGARGFNIHKDAVYAGMIAFLKYKVITELNNKGIDNPTDADIETELHAEMKDFVKRQEEKRKDYFVSCWHANERESEGMWKLYTTALNQGVAIQTTAERLCKAIGHDSYELGEVDYVTFDHPLKEEQTPIWYKRDAFAHEKEVRVVIKDVACKEKGIPILVDIDTLIESIYVSPTAPAWLAGLVKSVIHRYGIDKPVLHSRLNEKPVY